MKEKPFIAPEEGDFNAEVIENGSPEEKKELKKALKAVESGQFSSDTLADLGDKHPSQEFFAQRSYEDDRQRERERFEYNLEGFEKFIREKGISEEEISYGDLDYFLQSGTAGKSFTSQTELDKYIKRLEDLEREWHESK